MYARPPRSVEGLPGPPGPGRCLVMGVVNVTPDSFSDGGLFFDTDLAVKHGRQLAADGADLVDVGGESTRPGAVRPTLQQELDRVLPVVERLAADGVRVSVDTMRAEVAESAVRAGAVLVNDVSGGRADAEMFAVVARLGTPYVLMHWRAHSQAMLQPEHTTYGDPDGPRDVVDDVAAELAAQRDAAVAAGIDPSRIALDPGIGFSKTAAQNWQVLAGLERLHDLGHPLLVATSRKRFLGGLLADTGDTGDSGDTGNQEPRAPMQREDATTATTALAVAAGAWCVRAHAVRANLDAVKVAVAWAEAVR